MKTIIIKYCICNENRFKNDVILCLIVKWYFANLSLLLKIINKSSLKKCLFMPKTETYHIPYRRWYLKYIFVKETVDQNIMYVRK